MEQMQFSDVIKTEAEVLSRPGNRLRDVFFASIKSVAIIPVNIYKWVKEKVYGKVDKAMNVQDDNIHVRADEKTLLGMNFSDLYVGEVGTKDYQTVDANGNSATVSYLDFSMWSREARYLTEMQGSNLTFSESTDFASMIPEKRVGYELTLLSKKYAQGETLMDVNGNPLSYESIVSQYQDYCSQNGVNWQEAVWVCSEELQHETRDAVANLGSGWGIADDASNLRFVANSAHNLIVNAAGPEYQDMSIAGIDYAATLDTSAVPYGFFKTKINAVNDFIHGGFTNPFVALKEGAIEYVEGVSAASAAIDEDQKINNPEYVPVNEPVGHVDVSYFTGSEPSSENSVEETSTQNSTSADRYEQSCNELNVPMSDDNILPESEASADVTE